MHAPHPQVKTQHMEVEDGPALLEEVAASTPHLTGADLTAIVEAVSIPITGNILDTGASNIA